jgi:hypothetical protein
MVAIATEQRELPSELQETIKPHCSSLKPALLLRMLKCLILLGLRDWTCDFQQRQFAGLVLAEVGFEDFHEKKDRSKCQEHQCDYRKVARPGDEVSQFFG